MKNVPSPQEECVNVKPAYFKHTFKEPNALVNQGIQPLNLSLSEQENFSTLNMSL